MAAMLHGMDLTRAFELKDALADLLSAAVADPASPLHSAMFEDDWPLGRIKSRDTILVADAEFDQEPATMRAGGGTRNDTVEVEVVCAAVRKTNDTREVRDEAKRLATETAKLINAAANGAPPFGIAGARRVLIRGGRVRSFSHDAGREYDVYLRVEMLSRLTPA